MQIISRHSISILLGNFVCTHLNVLCFLLSNEKSQVTKQNWIGIFRKELTQGWVDSHRLLGMCLYCFQCLLRSKCSKCRKKRWYFFSFVLEQMGSFPLFIYFASTQLLCSSSFQSQRWRHAWLETSKINLLPHTSTLNAAWNIIVSPRTLSS